MSPQKIEANRANAQLSTGPITESGKSRSSFSAFKHGLTGKVHVATPEEAEALEFHCLIYVEALAPVGIIETDLAQEIAEDRWRLKRVRSIENSIFAQGNDDHAPNSGNPQVDAALAEGQTWVEQARNIQLLSLYEQRIRRAIEKNTAEFKAMQIERKAAHAQAQHQAILLAREAQSEGRVYDPASDFTPAPDHGGFVYSSSEITRILDRAQRLRRAQSLAEPDTMRPATRQRAA
jgi:hypothetical protein